jgi:serine protease Do
LNIAGGYRVIISDVFPGSPADRVGLQAGDVVKSLDGKFMENARQLNVNIYGKPIGSYINLTIIRDGKEVSKDVKVVERNDDDTRFMDYVNPEENFVERLGILAVELNTEIRELLPPLRKRGGILIAGSNGKARVLGDPIQPGDIIYKANNRPVNSLEELKNMINSLAPGEVIAFHAERNGKLIYLSYRMN